MDQHVLTGGLTVSATPKETGVEAATVAADVIVTALARRGSARIIFASAPSQESMLTALGADERIDWARVRSFHMDEYLGLEREHPQGFGQWLQDRLPDAALAGFERIDTTGEQAAEAKRYADLIAAEPIDLTCLGIGVNGHVAFNEPGVAKFDDDTLVRTVQLTHASRLQQVDDGLFRTIDDVPSRALTLTVPALASSQAMVCTVLGEQKAQAVSTTLTGAITPDCPATILRTHGNASMHLDVAAASLLNTTGDSA